MVYNKSIQLILNKRSEKMATKPVLRRAIAGQKSKASDYNWNFDQMINYLDNSVVELENETATINQAILTKADTSLDTLTADGEAKFDGKWTITNNIIVFEGRVLSTSSTLVPFTLDFLPDNGEYVAKASTASLQTDTGKLELFGFSGNTTKFNGNIYAVRIHNRVLTNEELKHNFELDYLRFGGYDVG